jgi:uncharacterized lipoprotein YehR (DUF1307 family)
MKKLIFALMLALMMLLMTACGGSGDTGGNGEDNPGDETGKYDQYKAGSYVEVMESGTYYMDTTAYLMGIETQMVMAVDGKDASVKVAGIGFPIRVLMLDGKAYYLNDDKKVYMVMPEAEVPDPEDTGVYDYTGIEFGKEGNGPIAGMAGVDDNAYDYEEFSITENGTEAVVRYYFKGDDLYAMEMTTGEEIAITFVINDFSGSIPAGLLELPSDYTEVDETGFM